MTKPKQTYSTTYGRSLSLSRGTLRKAHSSSTGSQPGLQYTFYDGEIEPVP